MPRGKKDDTSDSDSGPDDRNPVNPKKRKVETKETKTKQSSGGGGGGGSGPGGENSWNIGRNRFMGLSEFKGKWYVSIREYYDSNGELKPSKKGIMLSMEQYQKMKSHIADLDEAIKQNV